MQETWVQSLSQANPLEKGMAEVRRPLIFTDTLGFYIEKGQNL